MRTFYLKKELEMNFCHNENWGIICFVARRVPAKTAGDWFGLLSGLKGWNCVLSGRGTSHFQPPPCQRTSFLPCEMKYCHCQQLSTWPVHTVCWGGDRSQAKRAVSHVHTADRYDLKHGWFHLLSLYDSLSVSQMVHYSLYSALLSTRALWTLVKSGALNREQGAI